MDCIVPILQRRNAFYTPILINELGLNKNPKLKLTEKLQELYIKKN